MTVKTMDVDLSIMEQKDESYLIDFRGEIFIPGSKNESKNREGSNCNIQNVTESTT